MVFLEVCMFHFHILKRVIFKKNRLAVLVLVLCSTFLLGGQAIDESWECQWDIDAAARAVRVCCEQGEKNLLLKQGVEETPERLRFEAGEDYTVVTKKQRELNRQKAILERIVEAEAGDQDLRGRRLVANVILNRVNNEEFPDTIRDVVFAKRQFSPIADGSYERVNVSKKTEKAVSQALAGVDDSQGALYFMWREGSDDSNVKWFDRDLTLLYQHGDHEFFK